MNRDRFDYFDRHRDDYDPSGGARGCLGIVLFGIIIVSLMFAIAILTVATS